jgi:hypothetical protein
LTRLLLARLDFETDFEVDREADLRLVRDDEESSGRVVMVALY